MLNLFLHWPFVKFWYFHCYLEITGLNLIKVYFGKQWTQMKWYIMLHFIRVYTVLRRQKQSSENMGRKESNQTIKKQQFFGNYYLCPSIYTDDYPKFILTNQKEESIIA